MAWTDGTRRLDHDELVSWKSAAEAFGHLPRISDDLLDRLVARLTSGQLEAASADAKWLERGGNLSTGLVVLVGRWWSGVDGGDPRHYRELFKTGKISLYVPDPARGATFKVDFSDVRFNPDHLAAALDPAAQVAPRTPRTAPPAPALTANSAPPTLVLEEETDRRITPEEYQRWTHPRHALATLSDVADTETLIRTIHDHLEDGLIRSGAETIKITGGTQTWEFFELDPRFWLGWACLADATFWQTGNRELFTDSPACRRFNFAPMRFYRVRFHPDDLEKLRPPLLAPAQAPLVQGVRGLQSRARETPGPLPTIAPPKSDERRKDLPRPKDRDMERFSRLALEVFESDATEIFTYRALLALYPDNYVSREYFMRIFRLIRGAKSPGRSSGKPQSNG